MKFQPFRKYRNVSGLPACFHLPKYLLLVEGRWRGGEGGVDGGKGGGGGVEMFDVFLFEN